MEDKNTSAAALYRTIGIRKNLRVIGLLLLYWAAIFTGWIWYSRHSGTPMTDPSACIWTLFLLLPPLFLKVPYKLFSFPWTGTILQTADLADKEKSNASHKCPSPAFIAFSQDISHLHIRRADSTRIDFYINGQACGLLNGYYHPGDRIRKYWGLTYPVNLSYTGTEVFCPVCGTFNRPGDTKCYACRTRLVP